MKQTVLISGINGFLGSYLAKIISRDYKIIGIGRKTEIINNIKIFSSSELEDLNINPDYLVLCHAVVKSGTYTPTIKDIEEVNISLTKKIINTFPISKVIYISTASIYESTLNKIKEKSKNNPQNDYSKSKYVAEKLISNTNNYVICRFSSLYGIGMKENTIIPNYINQALHNNKIEVWGNGKRQQNYLYVVDACSYIKKAIEKFESIRNNLLLCVDKNEVTNLDLAKIISRKTNSNINFVKTDLAKSIKYDNSLTCNLLNWKPKTNLQTEIHKFIKWKKKQF